MIHNGQRTPYRISWLLILLLQVPAVKAHEAAIASAHPLATAAGHEVLAAGGNAFDAAVAVSAALAVVEPASSGLGGGGFWLIHRQDGIELMVDGREKAPQAASRDMYLDKDGQVVPNASVDGALAAGVPGTVAALDFIAKHYGKLSLAQDLAPAIKLAREGFRVGDHYLRLARFRLPVLKRFESSGHLLDRGEAPGEGFVLKQPDLANTLEAVAKNGADGFYSGDVAKRLVDAVRANGGLWTLDDLKDYSVSVRPPLWGEFQGMKITTASPPSSGGVGLLTMLNILSGYDLEKLSAGDRDHLIVEAMRRAYRDRAEYLGDPDFVADMPISLLINPYYGRGLAQSIRMDRATASASLPGYNLGEQPEAHNTTHFSIIDGDGNRVAATMSINYPFGSCLVAEGTGVILNDEMDDFSAKPGVPNVYGLIGSEANAIAAGKRPLSSMTPTFLEDDRGIVVLGTPGGSHIITMVLLATLDYAAGGTPNSMVAVPRFHHQFVPDQVGYEPGALSTEVVEDLKKRGHVLKAMSRTYGNMQVVMWDKERKRLLAASDPRGEGAAEVK
ncbi:MAG: gamma-glutamyltransferase [Gammaproteobacteria bacterium]|nr:gamma-glutamyltransferase [Gammaproteobacteria bacterium]